MVVDIGAYRGVGSPVRLERSRATYRRAPPAFGEHAEEILGGKP
jgi:crotonobetainyl-CoA:carnitine CoA-transferase CaiB-like acyl-CoA transferase